MTTLSILPKLNDARLVHNYKEIINKIINKLMGRLWAEEHNCAEWDKHLLWKSCSVLHLLLIIYFSRVFEITIYCMCKSHLDVTGLKINLNSRLIFGQASLKSFLVWALFY